MVDHAALYTVRIESCERMERQVRDKIALRAELTWDDDRRAEAEILGRSLARNPAETIDSLRRTPQGCDWLMARWALLAFTADTLKVWSEEQTNLAFDLLGTPAIFRAGQKPGALLDLDGRVVDPGNDLAALARREIAALKERREIVADLDEIDRARAARGLNSERDPELRLLRRYEARLHGQLKWCLKQVSTPTAKQSPTPGLRPNPLLQHAPAPGPEPKSAEATVAECWMPDLFDFGPSFDLEPEARQAQNRPAMSSAHSEKKSRKDEARREKLRKELSKRRA